MNITLSADKVIVERTREYARQRGTSVNQLVRDFLASLTGQDDRLRNAQEFERNALAQAGCSAEGFRFDREASHRRPEQP